MTAPKENEGLLNLIRALMDRLDRHMGDTDLDDPHDPDLQVMQWAAAVLKSHEKREP